MKRVLLLILIAVGTFVLFMLYKNPEVLEEIWLWLIGLLGVIIKSFKSLINYINKILPNKKVEALSNSVHKTKGDVNLSLLRYADDGETTIGLLYIDNKFHCYTLEDTFREVKIAGETRIPAGSYPIELKREDTPLTKKYKEKYPDWFTYHLELKGVTDFSSIYIHSGGDHTHTEGCILVSDSLSTGDANTFLTNSRNTFKSLYEFLSNQIRDEKKIILNIRDEVWFQNLAS